MKLGNLLILIAFIGGLIFAFAKLFIVSAIVAIIMLSFLMLLRSIEC